MEYSDEYVVYTFLIMTMPIITNTETRERTQSNAKYLSLSFRHKHLNEKYCLCIDFLPKYYRANAQYI